MKNTNSFDFFLFFFLRYFVVQFDWYIVEIYPFIYNMTQTNVTHQDLWHDCLLQLQKCTPQDDFASVFEPLKAIDFSDKGVLRLMVPNENSARKIEESYIKLLIPIVRKRFGSSATISYVFPKHATSNTSPAGSAPLHSGISKSTNNLFTTQNLKQTKFDSNLRPQYTFESYIVGESNLLVRSAGVAISQNPGGTNAFNPLFVYGASGMGKTHLIQAVGNAVQKNHPSQRVLYVAASSFQRQFQYAAQVGTLAEFIQFYQSIDVLIIDDIQEFAGKPGTQNIFFNIFNHLHMLGKQLIMTSDRPPVELRDIEERLITRFKWGLTAEIEVPDPKMKAEIIGLKAKQLNMKINPDMLEFIASRANSSIRELEGIITSLHAQTNLLGRNLNTALVKNILSDIVVGQSKEVDSESILEVICDFFKIERNALIKGGRMRNIATARQIAMYLHKIHTQLSLNAIGSVFGGKNHSTVHHACKSIAALIDSDKSIGLQVAEIEKRLIRG